MSDRQVDIDGRAYRLWLEDGLVRVRLPYRVDRERLTARLLADGYFVAYDPELEDVPAQGWGPEEDHEDYYPYWLPEPDLLAFVPRDYATADDGSWEPVVGEAAEAELRAWVPYLVAARQP